MIVVSGLLSDVGERDVEGRDGRPGWTETTLYVATPRVTLRVRQGRDLEGHVWRIGEPVELEVTARPYSAASGLGIDWTAVGVRSAARAA